MKQELNRRECLKTSFCGRGGVGGWLRALACAGLVCVGLPMEANAQPSIKPQRSAPREPAAPSAEPTTPASPKTPEVRKPGSEVPKGGAGAMVNLRPRFKLGETHRFTLTLKNLSKQVKAESDAGEGGGGKGAGAMEMTQELGLSLKAVEERAGGGWGLDLVYDSIKLTMKQGDGEAITLDSGTPGGGKKGEELDELGGLFSPLVGLTLRVEMDANGNISELKSGGGGGGGEGKGEMGDVSGLISSLGGGSMGGGLGSGDLVKSLLGPVTSSRAGTGEARVGDSWTNEDLVDGAGGKMKLTTVHTLQSHRDGVATLDQKGRFDLQPVSAGAGSGVGSGVPTIRESMFSGRTVWSTREGMLDSMTFKQKLVIETGREGTSFNEMDVRVVRRK